MRGGEDDCIDVKLEELWFLLDQSFRFFFYDFSLTDLIIIIYIR